MSLHKAIIKVLKDNGNKSMHYDEIADRINKDQLFIKAFRQQTCRRMANTVENLYKQTL